MIVITVTTTRNLKTLRETINDLQRRLDGMRQDAEGAAAEATKLREQLDQAIRKLEEARAHRCPNPRIFQWESAHPHHPRLLASSWNSAPWGNRQQYTWETFTGDDPDPLTLLDRELLDREGQEMAEPVYDEYQAAYRMWAMCRTVATLKSLVRDAAPAWEKYQEARAVTEAAWEQVRSLAAGADGWEAAVTALVDSYTPLRAAAQAWDNRAYEIAQVMWEYGEAVREMLPDLPVIAAEVGVNAFGWVVELPDDYTDPWHPNPLIGRVTREIDDRKARIREVAGLIDVKSPV